MLVSLKNRIIQLKEKRTGRLEQIALALESDGTLIITDADHDIPEFTKRVHLKGFPTDAAIEEAVSLALGGPRELAGTVDSTIDLDTSVLAGLGKMPVDIFDNVYLAEVKPNALILCVDMRNFSNFLCTNPEETVFSLIKEFTSNFLSCVNQFAFDCSYYKLMGDGAIVIWDETTEKTVAEALNVFDTYTDFTDEELFKPYGGLGLAGALVSDKVFKYEISAEASQLKYRDYVGYGINLACRLQALAIKDELILNDGLRRTGFVNCESRDNGKILTELQRLKGLRPEDSREALFYKR